MTIFREYFEERVKAFNEYHSNLVIKPTEEDIHQLRTTIKKLRTFNTLLDGLLFRQKDFPIGFTEVFKFTGEIRDIQVQQKVLDKCKYKSYLNYLCKDKISKFKIKDSFQEEIQYLEDKLAIVESYHIDDQVINNIKFHVKMMYSEVFEMVKNVSPEILHDIRKKVKRIYYIRLMLNDLEGIEKLDNLQDIIGLWHDCDITIDSIRNFDVRGIDDNDIEIIKFLTEKRDLLYNESLELIKTL